jgi:hypothetical protein
LDFSYLGYFLGFGALGGFGAGLGAGGTTLCFDGVAGFESGPLFGFFGCLFFVISYAP